MTFFLEKDIDDTPTDSVVLEEQALICSQALQKYNDPVPEVTSCLNPRISCLLP